MGNPAIIKVCRMLYYILSKTARRGIEPFIYGHFSLILRDYFEQEFIIPLFYPCYPIFTLVTFNRLIACASILFMMCIYLS